ncbi:DUF7683 domain-containing protein [Archangium gephyra]|uniref:DUF7683 domain-containing protein n=1 Tax=Archangium gephyra TaxID=48 RepID=UPI003B77591E
MVPTGSDWIISARRKDLPESLVARHALPDASAAQLRDALGLPDDENEPDLLHSYPIQTGEQAVRFERLLGMPLQLDTYDYFLEGEVNTRTPLADSSPGRQPARWEILVFRKDEDDLVFEYQLPLVPDAQTRALLGPPVEDVGHHVRWRITQPEVADRLAPYLRFPLDLTAPYDYSLDHWEAQRTRPCVLAYVKPVQAHPQELVAAYELHGATKERLRRILGLGEDNPMAGWYLIETEAQAAMLSPFLDQRLDLTAYDYTVQFYFPRSGS